MNLDRANKNIVIWLWIGFGMILIQILLGAITRLTGSGLSITKWDIVTGILFPISDQSWNSQFDLYKQTPQFQKINQDMNLNQFKFIFFWEYFHRLWARIMGLVFIIPFIFFLIKKWIDKALFIRLIIVVLLAGFVASLGWIMVASGLIQRPWVNAYKLALHLMSAVLLLCYLFYTIAKTEKIHFIVEKPRSYSIILKILIGLITLQIFIGGVMAGMKAGLSAPTWPKIQGNWIPEQMYHLSDLYNYLFTEYEISHTGPLVVQFFHRSVAYIIFLIIIMLCIENFRNKYESQWKIWGLFILCFIQMIFGIWTLINCVGFVPLWPAVFHQLFGIILLISVLRVFFTYKPISIIY